MGDRIDLMPGRLTLPQLRRIAAGSATFALDPSADGPVRAAAALVEQLAHGGGAVYGVTTGFGKLAQTRIAESQLEQLQLNLLRSHAVGVGSPLPDEVIRLILVLKAASLARGYSGVRPETIAQLLAFADHGLLPVVPGKGSVGASGDLAPLAHLSLALIGEGEVRYAGQVMPARTALDAVGLKPLNLGPKEGLALINGTQVSTALALAGLFSAERLLAAALVAGALSVDAARGTDTPFDPRIHQVRGQPGQKVAAEVLRDLLAGSAIRASHADCDRVQDPYCLRCQPQVMGACLDQLASAATRLVAESNAVSDNPLVFAEQGEILSGGNFHAEPVAFAADGIALALAEIGNMSERRTALLVDPVMSFLPAFLVKTPGIDSGFMMAQVTAAALASENKMLAHPASVDTIPTSANQEDHVSMATHAARRLLDMADNVGSIVGIELMAAAQGVDLLAPLKTSPKLTDVHAALREHVAPLDHDRIMAPDIAAAHRFLHRHPFVDLIGGLLDRPEIA
ncbi:MAG: histidine ammonia-lyase [Rhodospirillaceae bacterium]|nr:histidine ammonia-lyase [Rhodospirillaceae bacterium]